MKTVIFEVEEWEQRAFASLQENNEIEFVAEKLSAPNAAFYEESEIISTFIYSNLNSQIIENFKRLKLIATRSTGFDHIDIGYCRKHGITVCNVPTYGRHTAHPRHHGGKHQRLPGRRQKKYRDGR